MSRTPLRRKDMDRARCEFCAAGATDHEHKEPMFLHGRCHASYGSRVSYLNGILTIACRKCSTPIAEVEVAP
jgi:hypothetical protein